jgi:hypothetical protein
MTGIEITLLIIGIIGFIVIILKYKTGDPFNSCGRRVYVEL